MKNFLNEFKEFALRGNVMDMAVGVIIGAAFQSIITSFIDNIINPLIGLLVQVDFSDWVISMGSVDLKIGAFISTVINFILMAFVLFLMVKAVNKLHKKPEEKPAEPVKSDETKALEEIITILKEDHPVK